MPLPFLFGSEEVATGDQLDANFAALGAIGTIACTASGTNAITLTPKANNPNVNAYTDYLTFGFVAAAESTNTVTLQVLALGFLPVYDIFGQVVGGGGISLGSFYQATYVSTLNSGSGGFQLISGGQAGGGIRSPLIVTIYDEAGSGTYTTANDTATSDLFEVFVTGAGGGYASASPSYGGGAGGTVIKYYTGLTGGLTAAYVVGDAVGPNTNGHSSSFTFTGLPMLTGSGGGAGDSSNRNGGLAINGDINLQGGSGTGMMASGGGQIALGGASYYGSNGGGTNLVSDSIPFGSGADTGNLSGRGLIIVRQFRGAIPSSGIAFQGSVFSTQLLIVAGSTTDLGTLDNQDVLVLGNATINSFGSAALLTAPLYKIVFAGTPTLTYNSSSMILPGGKDIDVNAGDSAWALYLGSGKWRVTDYSRANGIPLAGNSNGVIPGLIGGLLPTNITATTMTVTAGAATDSTGTSVISLPTNTAWNVANGPVINGFIGGTTLPFGGTVHLFVVTGTAGTGTWMDTSTTPSPPTGYTTAVKLISSFVVEDDAFLSAYQGGTAIEVEGGAIQFIFSSTVLVADARAIGSTGRTLIDMFTPAGIVTRPIFRGTQTGTGQIIITSPQEADEAPTNSNGFFTTKPGFDINLTGIFGVDGNFRRQVTASG